MAVQFRPVRLSLIAAGLFAGVVMPAVNTPFAAAWASGMTGLIACLDANGLANGYGDYWVAKQVIFLTDRAVHIAQLDGASEMRFNFNEKWFTQRADGSAFAANFVVTDRLDVRLLAARFGPPSSILRCAGSTIIWLYDQAMA